MNADGTGITRLTDAPGSDGFPSWSPDGSAIVFSPGLNVIRPDGTGQTSIAVDGVGGDVEFASWGN
jgi:Tol biopolymer transport system component